MGFMEKEVLGSKSPLFGRRTAQLHMKAFGYQTSSKFMTGFSDEELEKIIKAIRHKKKYIFLSDDKIVDLDDENSKKFTIKIWYTP